MTPSDPAVTAREIAMLVAMPRLLAALGFEVNERTRRAPCPLHSGSNPSAFSWREDGRWRCFSCERGGDRIALVQLSMQCGFRAAVEFLAALADVEFRPGSLSREALQYQKQTREREEAEAAALVALEFTAWREARDVVLRLEALRRNVTNRLEELQAGKTERWIGEADSAWDELAEVSRQLPRAAAAICVISFGPARARFGFALDRTVREQLTDEALERGWVADEKGHRFEVQL
jgi:hypothetical protein